MLRLRTFGGVALLDGDTPVSGAMQQRRRLAVLVLVAAAGDRGVSRDKLLTWLWPDSETARARHTLSQWLFLLRRDLPVGALVGGDELRVDPALVASDLAEFEAALARADVEAAAAIHAGPFLDGFFIGGAGDFDRWADAERARHLARWRTAMERVATRRSAAGDPAGAADAWRRLATADPSDGRVALAFMRALDAAGDRAGALAHARVHAALLRDELELPVDVRVERYAAELRAAPPPPAPAPAPAAATAPAPAPPPAPTDAPSTSAGPTTGVGADAPAADRTTPPPLPGVPQRVRRARRRRWRRAAAIGAGAVALVAVVAGAALLLVPRHLRATALTLMTRGPSSLDPRRVVVAPLEDRTGDPALAAFGEMAADWMTQALARTAEFDVVDARTAAVTARVVDRIPRLLRADDRAIALAQETGAATVISGRYYREGDTVRVHVQLTDVESRRVRRSLGPVSGAVGSLSRLVEEVARRSAAQLVAAVDTTPAGLGVGQAPPPSFEAYRETSRAWERYYVSDFPGAFAHAGRAAALDASYMLPLIIQALFHSEQRDWADVDSLLTQVARRGVALSRLEQAGLDMIRADLAGDLDGQLGAAQELARLTPGSIEAHAHVAHVAVAANRPQAALAALAPLDPRRGVLLVVPFYWNWRSAALHALGRHAEELDATRSARRQFPTRNAVLLTHARALGAAGRAGEVREAARSALTERWDGAAVRRRALVEGSRELRAHGHAAGAEALLAEAIGELGAPDDALDTPRLEARALLLTEAQRWDEARAALRVLLAREPRRTSAVGALGVVAARTGDRAGAERAAAQLASASVPYAQGRPALWRARIAAALGDRARALALLEEALASGYPVMQGHPVLPGGSREFDYSETLVHADALLARLWSDPRFRVLVAPKG